MGKTAKKGKLSLNNGLPSLNVNHGTPSLSVNNGPANTMLNLRLKIK